MASQEKAGREKEGRRRRGFRGREPDHYRRRECAGTPTQNNAALVKQEDFYVATFDQDGSVVRRFLHLGGGRSGVDSAAEYPRHEWPGASHEREHRDGQS